MDLEYIISKSTKSLYHHILKKYKLNNFCIIALAGLMIGVSSGVNAGVYTNTTLLAADLNSDNTNLYDVLQTNTTEQQTYTMTKDEPVLSDDKTGYGSMKATNVTVNGGNYGIKGGGKGGIVIDANHSLTLQYIGAYTKTDDGVSITNFGFNGFQQSTGNEAVINNKGILNIADSVFSNNSSSSGGGILNSGAMTVENGIFDGNEFDGATGGSAIYNSGAITGTLSGNFSNNTTKCSTNATVSGGAINNNNGGLIDNISADFSKNSVIYSGSSNNYYAQGGAIANKGKIGNISGNFTKNSVSGYDNRAFGGAVYNEGTITNIGTTDKKITFTDNTATNGGAIFNNGVITNITNTDFSNNKAVRGSGGAIFNGQKGQINNISNSAFTGNSINAIYNTGTITSIDKTTFTNNTGSYGGAINNDNKIDSISNSVFTNNSANWGGAISQGTGSSYTQTIGMITDTDFIGNSAKNDGGAIFNDNGTIKIFANNKDITFKDNYQGSVIRDGAGNITDHSLAVANDIYNSRSLYLDANQGKTLTFKGTITDNKNRAQGTIIIGSTCLRSGIADPGTVVFDNTVTQRRIYIYQNAKATIDAKNINVSEAVHNIGILNLGDGELKKDIKTSDIPIFIWGTTNITGDVVNSARITQEYINILDDASLTTVADRVSSKNGISNAGTLNFTGGTLTTEVKDKTGITNITGDTTFNANVTQDKLNVDSDKTLKNNSGKTITVNNVTSNGSIENNGYLNLQSGKFSGVVSNDGTNGTINIGGTQSEQPVTAEQTTIFENTVTQNTININNGAIVKLGNNSDKNTKGTVSVNNFSIDRNGTTIDMLDGATGNSIYFGSTVTLNNDLKVNADIDLDNKVMDTISSSDSVNVNDNGHQIILDNINITKDFATNVPFTINFAQGNVKDYVTLKGTVINLEGTDNVKPKYSYITTYTKEDGNLNFTFDGNLYTVIHAEGNDRVFTMGKDEPALSGETSYGELNTKNATINGRGYSVLGGGKDGISVGSDKTLSTNDVVFDGFTTALTTTDGGTLSLKNTTFKNNATDIINNGTTELNGGVTLGTATGDNGTLNIISGENTLTGTLNQKDINVSSRATFNNKGTTNAANITNNGNITTDSTKLVATSGTITNNGTLTYNAGQRTVNDITGSADGNVVLDTKGNFVVNNKVSGTQLSLNSGTLYFGNNANIANTASFNANGGTINIADGKLNSTNLGNVNLNNKTNLTIDFNMNNLTSDKIIANITNNGGKFNINHLNISGRPTRENIRIHLGDTTGLGKSNVTSDYIKLPSVMTPIRKISGSVQDGYLIYGPSGNNGDWKTFNPSVLVAPVAAQLGGYLTMLNAYEEGFRNLDMKMLMTQSERQALKMTNKYASVATPQVFSPTYLPEKESAGWFRPYATFERVGLRGGPKVSNILYGSFFGGDSDMYELSHGWDFQWSLYAGYTGSHQAFQGNDIYQNGGIIGATGVWYKGNFFTALTANVGASVAEASTMFGSEDFPMLMAGVASKTGYNFEFFRGKFIFQPYYMMSYTFVNTFNYHNGAGVRLTSDPLHAINIAPGIKLIGNLKNGWQPYFSIQMVWNIIDRSEFKAANVSLPDMSIKPYVQYGVGLQRRWGERFTGYIQAMIRNGGRNGVALSAGFRWAIGKNYSKNPFRGKTSRTDTTGSSWCGSDLLLHSDERKVKSNLVGVKTPVYATKVKDNNMMNAVPFLK